MCDETSDASSTITYNVIFLFLYFIINGFFLFNSV